MGSRRRRLLQLESRLGLCGRARRSVLDSRPGAWVLALCLGVRLCGVVGLSVLGRRVGVYHVDGSERRRRRDEG